MSLLYALVARGDVPLAEYAAVQPGSLRSVAQEAMARLQPDQAKLTIVSDRHTFNMLRREGLTFVVVADEAYGRQIPFAFLERVSEDLFNSGPMTLQKAKTAPAGSLERAFAPKLKQHMDYCVANPHEISRIAGVQKKVDEVRTVMVDNIDRVIERGERIELLVDKTDTLRAEAQRFQKQGAHLRKQMWWASTRMKIIAVAAVLLLVLVIFLLACFAGGRSCVAKREPQA